MDRSLEEIRDIVSSAGVSAEVCYGEGENDRKYIRIESDGEYYDELDWEDDKMELNRAWEDFKAVNTELKENGFRSIYKMNIAPERDDKEWVIFIKRGA